MPPQSFDSWADVRHFLDASAHSFPILLGVMIGCLFIGIMLGAWCRDYIVNFEADHKRSEGA